MNILIFCMIFISIKYGKSVYNILQEDNLNIKIVQDMALFRNQKDDVGCLVKSVMAELQTFTLSQVDMLSKSLDLTGIYVYGSRCFSDSLRNLYILSSLESL